MYVCMYVCMYVYIYIYIYPEVPPILFYDRGKLRSVYMHAYVKHNVVCISV